MPNSLPTYLSLYWECLAMSSSSYSLLNTQYARTCTIWSSTWPSEMFCSFSRGYYSIFHISPVLKYCNFIFGIVICAVARFLLDVSYKVSLISLLVISIERFRATRRTLTRSRPYTFRRRIMAICVSWLIPLPFAAYFLYEDHHGWRDEDFQHFFSTDNILHVILCFVIFVLCVLTIRRLSRPQAIQSHLNQQQQNVRRRQTQAAVRMVLVSVLLYTCCWLPIFVFHKFSVGWNPHSKSCDNWFLSLYRLGLFSFYRKFIFTSRQLIFQSSYIPNMSAWLSTSCKESLMSKKYTESGTKQAELKWNDLILEEKILMNDEII